MTTRSKIELFESALSFPLTWPQLNMTSAEILTQKVAT